MASTRFAKPLGESVNRKRYERTKGKACSGAGRTIDSILHASSASDKVILNFFTTKDNASKSYLRSIRSYIPASAF